MPLHRPPEDLSVEFAMVARRETLCLARKEACAVLAEAGMLDRCEAPPESIAMGSGRGGAWSLDVPGLGPVVLRPGRRGGLPGRVLRSRYFLGRRFFDELVLTERLLRRGAPVPVPLAAVHRPRLPGYETWLITRRVVGARRLDSAIREGSAGAAVAMKRAGVLVARLHASGGGHADLNATNVLLGEGGRDTVIDLDRGRLFPGTTPERVRSRNLSRLRRSLERLGLVDALAAWHLLIEAYEEAFELATTASCRETS